MAGGRGSAPLSVAPGHVDIRVDDGGWLLETPRPPGRQRVAVEVIQIAPTRPGRQERPERAIGETGSRVAANTGGSEVPRVGEVGVYSYWLAHLTGTWKEPSGTLDEKGALSDERSRHGLATATAAAVAAAVASGRWTLVIP